MIFDVLTGNNYDPVTGDIKDYKIRKSFRLFFHDYSKTHVLSAEQKKAGECISRCKTGELGYNISYCKECGHTEIHASSCNNRHCPCCQLTLEKKWIAARQSELMEGIAYYHVVFTVPQELNDLIFMNQELLYNLLMRSASDSLITLCADKKYMGALPGIVSVLHTWGQQLNYHPHLHVMLSGGGLNRNGNFIETRHKGFIIPQPVLAKMFRGNYLDLLNKYYESGSLIFKGSCACLENPDEWKSFLDKLYSKKWLPFLKETFNGNGNAIEYLARYAFRTAISNNRITEVTEKEVSFRYTDYADNNAKKVKTVTGEEFIQLFLQHVLPKGFHRVRFTGYLSNCCKSRNLKHINRLRGVIYSGNPMTGKNTAELMLILFHVDLCCCKNCNGRNLTRYRMRYPPGINVTT